MGLKNKLKVKPVVWVGFSKTFMGAQHTSQTENHTLSASLTRDGFDDVCCHGDSERGREGTGWHGLTITRNLEQP